MTPEEQAIFNKVYAAAEKFGPRVMGGAAALSSLVGPTLSNLLLVKKIREHPSARKEVLKYGLGSAGLGAGLAGSATYAGQPAIGRGVERMVQKFKLPQEISTLFSKTPRAGLAVGAAAFGGSLLSDLVNAHMVNKIVPVPNFLLTLKDKMQKYSAAKIESNQPKATKGPKNPSMQVQANPDGSISVTTTQTLLPGTPEHADFAQRMGPPPFPATPPPMPAPAAQMPAGPFAPTPALPPPGMKTGELLELLLSGGKISQASLI